jgi:DNA gyrase/topoisomerase IV subunit A
MDTQGNWGDSSRGIEASAERYIEGKLSTLAEHLFCDSIEYAEMVPGEIDKDEPKALPALLPLCFINGSSGIPSGLPTLNIPTLDLVGMIDYYLERDVKSITGVDFSDKMCIIIISY